MRGCIILPEKHQSFRIALEVEGIRLICDLNPVKTRACRQYPTKSRPIVKNSDLDIKFTLLPVVFTYRNYYFITDTANMRRATYYQVVTFFHLFKLRFPKANAAAKFTTVFKADP